MTTRSAWCSLQWLTIQFWSVMRVEVSLEPRQASKTTASPLQYHRRFSKTAITTDCLQTFHRHDLRITTTWTTTRTDWTGFPHRSELPRTWSRSSRPTEINIRAGPNGMAKAVHSVGQSDPRLVINSICYIFFLRFLIHSFVALGVSFVICRSSFRIVQFDNFYVSKQHLLCQKNLNEYSKESLFQWRFPLTYTVPAKTKTQMN